jgi:competence protein ComEC
VLSPESTAGLDSNEASVVARLVYGNASVLLMADVPKFVEYRLTQLEGPALESDVLKVAHHGSRTSTSDILLQVAKPSVAVISAGESNQYGHPHAEVLATLARYGIPVLRTDEEGTVILHSAGETFEHAH